jgi:hypothetical protein
MWGAWIVGRRNKREVWTVADEQRLKRLRVKCCYCEERFYRDEVAPLAGLPGYSGGEEAFYFCLDAVTCSDRMEVLEPPSGRRDWTEEEREGVRSTLLSLLTNGLN